MSPALIASIILEAMRAGIEIRDILTEVQGKATPEEWASINAELDAAVAAWKAA